MRNSDDFTDDFAGDFEGINYLHLIQIVSENNKSWEFFYNV